MPHFGIPSFVWHFPEVSREFRGDPGKLLLSQRAFHPGWLGRFGPAAATPQHGDLHGS
jgi:hypothetical protein